MSPPGFLISKCCLPLFKAKPGKAKRVRTIFSSEQLARLEQEFARQQYLVGQERCLLASSLHLTEEQVSPSSSSDSPRGWDSPSARHGSPGVLIAEFPLKGWWS